jgi:hypothetical protein
MDSISECAKVAIANYRVKYNAQPKAVRIGKDIWMLLLKEISDNNSRSGIKTGYPPKYIDGVPIRVIDRPGHIDAI